MNRALALPIAAALLAFALPRTASATPPRGEISALVGWGTAAFNDWEGNNFGPGVGLRGGVTFGRLWLGATGTIQFGMPSAMTDLDASGKLTTGNFSLATFGGGGELGLDLRFGQFVVRPYAWTGALLYFQSPFSTFTPGPAQGYPIVRFAVAPSLHVDYELPRSGVFFGADVRVNLLVPGTKPQVQFDGLTQGPSGWNYQSEEHFTGELSIYVAVGKRF